MFNFLATLIHNVVPASSSSVDLKISTDWRQPPPPVAVGGCFFQWKGTHSCHSIKIVVKPKLNNDLGGSSSLCSVVNWVVNASILQTGKSNKGLLANIWQSHITTMNVCQTNRVHSLKSIERKKEILDLIFKVVVISWQIFLGAPTPH